MMMIIGGKFPFLVLSLQTAFVIIFAFFVTYERHEPASIHPNSTAQSQTKADYSLSNFYPMFQDVNVMIFAGFGFLMTFLKKYGYSAIGLNMLLAAISIQWAMIMQGVWKVENFSIPLNVINLINGNFASATVLISFGALLGKASPLQLVVMSILEIALFACNEHLGVHVLKAADIGGSIFVHTFGAYFGIATSCALFRKDFLKHEKDRSNYHSDLFAMIGTLFLWAFWPSFNSALASAGDEQQRGVLNTLLSLLACCAVTFAVSSLLDERGRMSMVHVQNATLAGGVAIGSACNAILHPFGAMLVGSLAGVLSTVGYRFLTPCLTQKLRLHDTCGVNNLHGMPGILAGLVSAIVASTASEHNYGAISLCRLYPARCPAANSTELRALVEPGDGWSGAEQACAQLGALASTLLVAACGGLLTGVIIRQPIFDPPKKHQLFDDADYWEVPDEDHP